MVTYLHNHIYPFYLCAKHYWHRIRVKETAQALKGTGFRSCHQPSGAFLIKLNFIRNDGLPLDIKLGELVALIKNSKSDINLCLSREKALPLFQGSKRQDFLS